MLNSLGREKDELTGVINDGANAAQCPKSREDDVVAISMGMSLPLCIEFG